VLLAATIRQIHSRWPRITLVHGDAKPGNFAFVGDDVSAVFDWEMTTVGDPLTDMGWMGTAVDATGRSHQSRGREAASFEPLGNDPLRQPGLGGATGQPNSSSARVGRSGLRARVR
jgi:aminoglycoside phosphotransferase (APT) family kinase protein